MLKSVVAIALLGSSLLQAQPTGRLKDWGNIAKVSPGLRVRIMFKDTSEKVKGRLISSDDDGVSVKLSDGTSRTIAKGSIRQFQASSKARQLAPFIGGVAGAAALGVTASRPRFDLVTSAVLLCAAAGAAIGFGIGMGFRYSIVYEAP